MPHGGSCPLAFRGKCLPVGMPHRGSLPDLHSTEKVCLTARSAENVCLITHSAEETTLLRTILSAMRKSPLGRAKKEARPPNSARRAPFYERASVNFFSAIRNTVAANAFPVTRAATKLLICQPEVSSERPFTLHPAARRSRSRPYGREQHHPRCTQRSCRRRYVRYTMPCVPPK